jgi:bifunctional NMN adenylyltransferase/nudix hydrolase
MHEGHLQLIKEVKSKHNRLIIVLGVAPVKGGRKNPLDYYTRERMIKQLFPEIIVLPLSDQASDKVWSRKLDELLSNNFNNESFILYGSRDSFIPYYSGRFPTADLPPVQDFNATAQREAISDKVFDTTEFRAGVIYSTYNLYPKVYPTVDIALFRNNRSELLLGRKSAESGWRLPGGFTDPADISFDAAAKRELLEECGPVETSQMQYELSLQMDDWRYRSEVDKIITTLFSTDLLFGEPAADDDLADMKWIKVTAITTMIANGEIVSTHIPLLKKLAEKYSTND